MLQLTKIRLIVICLALIVLVACNTGSPKNPAKSESDLEVWRNKVARILQSGWEVNIVNNSLVITRKEPVTYYNPIALPAFDSDLRMQMIERGKNQEKYQITVDVVEKLSSQRYEELKAINAKTDKELKLMEGQMQRFAAKDSYMPVTEADHLLFKEYQNSLSTLPYHKLPDLYDDNHSIYVTTTRPAWTAFYSVREEQECRAVIENIYSYAEVYEAYKLAGWPPGESYGKVAAFECFNSDRVYDRYLHKKALNLQ